jgi:hypothetical protein
MYRLISLSLSLAAMSLTDGQMALIPMGQPDRGLVLFASPQANNKGTISRLHLMGMLCAVSLGFLFLCLPTKGLMI